VKPVPGTIGYAISAYQREMYRAFVEWLRKRMNEEKQPSLDKIVGRA
jgi:hypothetical protein